MLFRSSMRLLADGLVSLSDGVCAFLGNGPSLFWLGKSKPLCYGRGKIKSVYVVPVGICWLVVVKKEKPSTVVPVGSSCRLVVVKKKNPLHLEGVSGG